MSFIRNILDAVSNNLISGDAYYLIVKAVIVTAGITLLSWLITVVFGIIFSYFMSYEKKVVSGLVTCLSFLFRSTPVLCMLLLFYYVIFRSTHINPVLLSALAIGLYGAGHYSEMLAHQLHEAKKKQSTELISRLKQVYFSVTMPEMAEETMFFTKRLFIQLFQWTTVVGYLTVNDLTAVMNEIGQRTMYPFFSIAFCIIFYLAATILIEGIFHLIQKHIS